MKPTQYNDRGPSPGHRADRTVNAQPTPALQPAEPAPPAGFRPGRRRALAAAGVLLGGWVAGASAAGGRDGYRVPETRDLAALRAGHPGKGILLAFFMDGCPFCHRIDQTYLGGMHDHADYRERIVMRHVRFARGARIVGFDGNEVEVTAFARSFGVRVLPTLVALDADAQAVAAPLVGIRNIEFYGFDLDRLIDAASGESATG